ncbi:hypothetical protein KUM39_16795 [Streptomyces sp. J2-1]|uniref:hypothetical protein n=1 Tax=Streptomyces corallincola TaxID=2851888 RepID=UPI001C38BE59|nr:hypothetical protein [Streptomyces corallincola]MBV2356012.1 hypothetical protein [Streptomyces corallincola]
MNGRTSAPYGHHTARPQSRARTAVPGTPAVRGLAAAVLTVLALVAAANTGPVHAEDSRPVPPTASHTNR